MMQVYEDVVQEVIQKKIYTTYCGKCNKIVEVDNPENNTGHKFQTIRHTSKGASLLYAFCNECINDFIDGVE